VNGGSELVSWGSLGGYPICSFRQFLARMCRFATIQNVTDGQTDDDDDDARRHWVPKAPVRSAKNWSTFGQVIAKIKGVPFYGSQRSKRQRFFNLGECYCRPKSLDS